MSDRGRRALAPGLCLLFLLACADAASAARGPDRATLVSGEPPVATGLVGLGADEAAVLWGEGTRALEFAASKARVVVHRVSFHVLDTPLGSVGHSPRHVEEEVDLAAVRVRLVEGAGFVALLHGGGEGRIRASFASPEGVRLPLDREGFAYAYQMDADYDYFFGHAIPEPTLELRVPAEAIETSGPLSLFVTGARLRVEDAEGRSRTVDTGERRTPGPLGALGEGMLEYRFALVQAADLVLVERGDAAPLAAFAWPRATVDGTMLFPEATGTASLGDGDVAFERRDLELKGLLDVRFLPAREATAGLPALFEVERRYEARGAFEHVKADGRLVLQAAPIVAGVGAAFAVGARLRLGTLLRLYTRLSQAEVLAHPARERLLGLVDEAPGIHLRALQRGSQLSWGPFSYHVMVLERHGLMRVERLGRYARAYRSRAASDAASSAPPSAASGRVLQVIEDEAGLTQAQVASRLSISVQLASYHLQGLKASGRVREQRTRPRRYYAAEPGPPAARAPLLEPQGDGAES